MNSSNDLPVSVSTRKMRSSRTISKQDLDEYSSDFDEFGYDNDISITHDTPENLGNESAKKNKTRLGKMMSKAANTVGSLAFLAPKKVSSEQDRNSLSRTTTTNNSRYSTSTIPSEIPRTRPESLPVSRHSESQKPILATLSNRSSQRYTSTTSTTHHNRTVGDAFKSSQTKSTALIHNQTTNTMAESVNVSMSAEIIANAETVMPVLQVISPATSGSSTDRSSTNRSSTNRGSTDRSSTNSRALPTTPIRPHESINSKDSSATTTSRTTPDIYSKKTVSTTDANTIHDEVTAASISDQDFPSVPSHAIHLTSPHRALGKLAENTTPSGLLVKDTIHSDNIQTTRYDNSSNHQNSHIQHNNDINNNTNDITNSNNSNSHNHTTTTIHASDAVLFNENTPIVTAKPVQVNAKPLAIIRYLRLLALFSPEPLSSFFARLEPIIHKWASALHFISLTLYIFMEILLELTIEIWVFLKPYKPELLLPSFAGIIMCFFGGSFVTTIAAAEAYRMVGYDSTRECLYSLIEDFQNVLQVAEQDAAVGIDDIEPSEENTSGHHTSSSNKKICKGDDDGDIWSDWRIETEASKRVDRPVSIHRPVAAYYSDGTEGLGEIHHAAAVSAQVYHIEDTPPTPCSRTHREHHNTSSSSTTTTDSTVPEHSTTIGKETRLADTIRPTSSRMTTRSSLRRTSTDLSPTATAVLSPPAATSTQKKLRRRRSMFSPHSEELDAFRSTVLEHRTPIKQRGSAVSSTLSTPPLHTTTTTTNRDNNIDSLNSELEQQQHNNNNLDTNIATTITSSNRNNTPNNTHKKRTSVLPQSIDEYQRDQELYGADTVASRALFFIQNVDPQRFTNAIIGINTGFVAVIATLKVQFAKTITLGTSLSKIIENSPIKTILLPFITLLLPKQYKKWDNIILIYIIKSFCISIAWTLKRIISSFHSSIRGGLMFSKNILEYIITMGVLKRYNINISYNSEYIQYLDKIIGYSIAVLGLWFQLSYGFALPFPLNIILFPFSILEYVLVWMVNNSHYIIGH